MLILSAKPSKNCARYINQTIELIFCLLIFQSILYQYFNVDFVGIKYKLITMSTNQKQNFQFVYKGVQYDATDYAETHPGGLVFLQNMKNVTKDFTEYFRQLQIYTGHSIQIEPKRSSNPFLSFLLEASQSLLRNIWTSIANWKSTSNPYGRQKPCFLCLWPQLG